MLQILHVFEEHITCFVNLFKLLQHELQVDVFQL